VELAAHERDSWIECCCGRIRCRHGHDDGRVVGPFHDFVLLAERDAILNGAHE
jgi:hypothetical protein